MKRIYHPPIARFGIKILVLLMFGGLCKGQPGK